MNTVMRSFDQESKTVAAFIYQWTRGEYKAHRTAGNKVLDHAASSVFQKRGLEKGDYLYVVACFSDTLYLMGRLDLDAVLNPAAAAERFRRPVADFESHTDHAVCAKGEEGFLHFDLVIPNAVVAQLTFANGTLPKMAESTAGVVPSGQTFRTVRELSEQAEDTLDALLLAHEANLPD